MSADPDDRVYRVVVNHEEQYSIWIADREPPAGWRAVGNPGDKQECLTYIERVWADMLPPGIREPIEDDGYGQRRVDTARNHAERAPSHG
jgi:MbtH protein